MKNNYDIIGISLLLGLFIYLFYRTENTVATRLFITLISPDHYETLRKHITIAMPLSEHVIYSLPEGLWVFCITLTSNRFFLKIAGHKINLILAPLVVAVAMELLQLLGVTHGRFDWWDIGVSLVFWFGAVYLTRSQETSHDVLKPFSTESYVCVASYLIVFLSHVWR